MDSDVVPITDKESSPDDMGSVAQEPINEDATRPHRVGARTETEEVEDQKDIEMVPSSGNMEKGKDKAFNTSALRRLGGMIVGLLRRPGLITIPIVGIGVVILVWFVYTSYLVKSTIVVFAKVQDVELDETISLSEEAKGDD